MVAWSRGTIASINAPYTLISQRFCPPSTSHFPEVKLSSTFLSSYSGIQNFSKTISKSVLAIFLHRLDKFVLRQFQNLYSPQIRQSRPTRSQFLTKGSFGSRSARDQTSIKTQCRAIKFTRLLPSTTLLPRGETLFHLPPVNILEKFKDFPSTT